MAAILSPAVEIVLQSTFYLLSVCLFVLGVIGCVVPVLPGPVLAYAGFLCLLPTPRSPGLGGAISMGLVAGIATILDFAVPGWGAKKFQCSKGGVWGSVAGAIVGMFFFPLGLVLGPFLGAVAGELLSGRRLTAAAWGGIGAFLGFLFGVLLKLGACLLMLAAAFLARSP